MGDRNELNPVGQRLGLNHLRSCEQVEVGSVQLDREVWRSDELLIAAIQKGKPSVAVDSPNLCEVPGIQEVRSVVAVAQKWVAKFLFNDSAIEVLSDSLRNLPNQRTSSRSLSAVYLTL